MVAADRRASDSDFALDVAASSGQRLGTDQTIGSRIEQAEVQLKILREVRSFSDHTTTEENNNSKADAQLDVLEDRLRSEVKSNVIAELIANDCTSALGELLGEADPKSSKDIMDHLGKWVTKRQAKRSISGKKAEP